MDVEEYVATSGLVTVSAVVSTVSPLKSLITKSSAGTPTATALIVRVRSSLSSKTCFGPQAPPGGTRPWNVLVYAKLSDLLCRASTAPVTPSTRLVKASDEPPEALTTLASRTGRTDPSAIGRARRRTCCSCAKPGTVSRVHPPLTLLVMAEVSRPPASDSSVAAFSQPWSGVSVAAGIAPVVRARDEET